MLCAGMAAGIREMRKKNRKALKGSLLAKTLADMEKKNNTCILKISKLTPLHSSSSHKNLSLAHKHTHAHTSMSVQRLSSRLPFVRSCL